MPISSLSFGMSPSSHKHPRTAENNPDIADQLSDDNMYDMFAQEFKDERLPINPSSDSWSTELQALSERLDQVYPQVMPNTAPWLDDAAELIVHLDNDPYMPADSPLEEIPQLVDPNLEFPPAHLNLSKNPTPFASSSSSSGSILGDASASPTPSPMGHPTLYQVGQPFQDANLKATSMGPTTVGIISGELPPHPYIPYLEEPIPPVPQRNIQQAIAALGMSSREELNDYIKTQANRLHMERKNFCVQFLTPTLKLAQDKRIAPGKDTQNLVEKGMQLLEKKKVTGTYEADALTEVQQELSELCDTPDAMSVPLSSSAPSSSAQALDSNPFATSSTLTQGQQASTEQKRKANPNAFKTVDTKRLRRFRLRQIEAAQTGILPTRYRTFVAQEGNKRALNNAERRDLHKNIQALIQNGDVQNTPAGEERLNVIAQELLKKWPLPPVHQTSANQAHKAGQEAQRYKRLQSEAQQLNIQTEQYRLTLRQLGDRLGLTRSERRLLHDQVTALLPIVKNTRKGNRFRVLEQELLKKWPPRPAHQASANQALNASSSSSEPLDGLGLLSKAAKQLEKTTDPT